MARPAKPSTPGRDITIDYKPPGPVARRFHLSGALLRLLMGPVGSGKSSSTCIELFRIASSQHAGRDGVRRSRFAIIRNTYPELKTTTLETWLSWFPEELGTLRMDAPITYSARIEPTGETPIEFEVWFLAMDRPKDIKKLLSLEVTAIWINEAREVPKAVVDLATSRVGRYPHKREKPAKVPAHEWPRMACVILDTNPPDDDHWIYHLAEEPPDEATQAATQKLRELGVLAGDQPYFEVFKQPSGMSRHAENIHNLPVGYYHRLVLGKKEEWIKVYVHGLYGSSEDGKPVYSEYNDAIHCAGQDIPGNPGLVLLIAFDFGLTPAAAFMQQTMRGRVRIIDELVAEDMGIQQFAESVVIPHIAAHYPDYKVLGVGDPAGLQRKDTDEATCFDVLEGLGFTMESPETNAFMPRRESVAWFLNRMVDGLPALEISPKCKVIRKGFNGGYKYRRMQVSGQEAVFTSTPLKNRFSHPHDAVQYGCLFFRGNTVMRKPIPPRRRVQAVGVADTVAGY